MLTQAGLDGWVSEVVVGEGFVPGVRKPDQLADPANPCKGAVPREHSHFFTEDGRFGSLDWNGDTVDDGTYEMVDADTFVVSKEFPDVRFSSPSTATRSDSSPRSRSAPPTASRHSGA